MRPMPIWNSNKRPPAVHTLCSLAATKGDTVANTEYNTKITAPYRRADTKSNSVTNPLSNAKTDEVADARTHTTATLWPRSASRGQARWHCILPTM